MNIPGKWRRPLFLGPDPTQQRFQVGNYDSIHAIFKTSKAVTLCIFYYYNAGEAVEKTPGQQEKGEALWRNHSKSHN